MKKKTLADGESKDYEAVHKTALERFRLGEAAYSDQAARELDDIKFAARIGQWTTAELEARKPLTSTGVTLTGRPSLVVDKLRQPIQQLENQQRQANLAVDVHPISGGATQATAEMLQGLYRHIQVSSRADQIARFWAYSRALKCGRGVYKVEKKFALEDPEPDDPARFDQELVLSRILNQAGVILDPFAQEPDWSDGEWGFEKAWVACDTYNRDHETFSDWDDDQFNILGGQSPGWIKRDGNTWSVLEVRYWYVEFGKEETLDGPDGQTRTTRSRTVYCCKLNVKEITERVKWDGKYIPLIPVIANEENIDGNRIWEGLVAPAKDSQRTFNFLTSAFVETTALAPKAPWLVDAVSIEPFKAWWDQSNARNFPYLPYKSRAEGGTQVPPPQRMFGEPPIQAIAQGLHQFDANINATTGFFDPSRGNLSSGERSGVALQALQKQSETGNSGYLDNLAQISMTYEAKVILDLIPHVYDRPGRIERILGASDKPETVMLNAPFLKGQDGQPVPAEGLPPDTPDVIMHKLEEGVYASTVTIGKSHTNARAESAELIGGIIQAEPQLLMILGDLWFANMDGPGMPEMAARMKKLLPAPLQESPQGQPNAQQLQQQVGQLTQQLQQMQPLADANQAKLQQAQFEAQSQERIAAAQLASQEKIAQFEAETKRQIEQIKAETERQKAQAAAMTATQTTATKAQADIQTTVIAEAAEDERQRQDHAHEAQRQENDLRQESDMTHTQHAQNMQAAEVSHAHARTLQAEKPKGTK